MLDWWVLILAALAGGALGAVYFGGLWLTVRRLAHTRRPTLWLLSSFFVRTALTLLGFYLVLRMGWATLLACLVGFLLARVLLMRQLGSAAQEQGQS